VFGSECLTSLADDMTYYALCSPSRFGVGREPERQFQAWGLDPRERGLAQGHSSQGSGDQGLASSDQSRETVNVGESV
jgi:hypothetical protein